MAHSSQQNRIVRAKISLEGLSVGDAIGEALSYQYYRCREIGDFTGVRAGSIRYTDDTAMSIALVETLQRLGESDEDVLAWAYGSHFRKDPERGYGKGARRLLEEIATGGDWRALSKASFAGGSFGNGAAMRIAPLGAYFADRIELVPRAAESSSIITHAHAEGIAGAIAVALTAAVASRESGSSEENAIDRIWEAVLAYTPESRVKKGIETARALKGCDPIEVAKEVGNGAEVSAQDTVPFCIWSACENLSNYREAILQTVGVGGDCDTNAAFVGGIVAGYAGIDSIPEDWLRAREEVVVKV